VSTLRTLFGDITPEGPEAGPERCEHPATARALNGALFATPGTFNEVCTACGAILRPSVATFAGVKRG
jgi:hypothetical protein